MISVEMANNNREWEENSDKAFNKDYVKLLRIAGYYFIHSKVLILNPLKDDRLCEKCYLIN